MSGAPRKTEGFKSFSVIKSEPAFKSVQVIPKGHRLHLGPLNTPSGPYKNLGSVAANVGLFSKQFNKTGFRHSVPKIKSQDYKRIELLPGT